MYICTRKANPIHINIYIYLVIYIYIYIFIHKRISQIFVTTILLFQLAEYSGRIPPRDDFIPDGCFHPILSIRDE